jgi:rhodanese-related sulfurtransferase
MAINGSVKMGEVILDVRERDEFAAEHVEYSINVPLSQFGTVAPGVLNQLRERDVVLMCRSGNRARMASSQISNLGFSDKIRAQVYNGGITEWKKLGKPVVVYKKGHLPIMRQVQLIAGGTVLVASVLALTVHPWFAALSAFFGAGLTLAGATGFCGLANVLALMPWNKAPGAGEELCAASPASGSCATHI